MSRFRDSDNLERRRETRQACDAATCCRIVDPHGGLTWTAGIRDLSASGISLLVDKQFELGQLLAIELTNSPRDFSRKCFVEVRHSDIFCPNNTWLHGCRFTACLNEAELQGLL